jgi:fatty acid desaturase
MFNRESARAEIHQSIGPAILSTLNFSLAAVHLAVNIFQFFILPLYFLPNSIWWSLTLIPFAGLNNSFWALIHESIHDLFNPSRRINAAIGRLLSILFGSPFRLLRLTHLSHHKFNRSLLERGTEIYNPQETSKLAAGLGHFFQIFGGLYLSEALTPLLFFLPGDLFHKLGKRILNPDSRHEQWLARNFMKDKWIREIRMDGIAVIVFFGLSAFCYRGHWQLLAGVLIARAFFISFLDNVYHYGTPLNDRNSGYNLWLPRILSKLQLNFNLHGVHHKHPDLPWIRLPGVLAQQGKRFDENYFTAALRQLHGPVPLLRMTVFSENTEVIQN